MVPRPFGARIVTLGLEKFSLDVGNNTFEARCVAKFATVLVLPLNLHVEIVAVEHCVLNLFGKLVPGCGQFEFQFGGQAVHHSGHVGVNLAGRCRPGQQNTIGNRIVWVTNDQFNISTHLGAETPAILAGAEWGVE